MRKDKEHLEGLEAKRPLLERINRSQQQIESIDKEIMEKRQSQKEASDKLHELQTCQNESQAKFAITQALLQKTAAISLQLAQMDRISKELAQLRAQLDNENTEGDEAKSISRLQGEYKIAEKECNELTQEIEKRAKEIRCIEEETQRLTSRLVQLHEQANNLSHSIAKKNKFESSIQDCIQKEKFILFVWLLTIDPIEEILVQLNNQKQEQKELSEKSMSFVVREGHKTKACFFIVVVVVNTDQHFMTKKQQTRNDSEKLQRIYGEYQRLQQQLSEIRSVTDSVEKIKIALETLKAQENELTIKIKEQESYLSKIETSVRDIKANLEYRDLQKKRQEKRTVLKDLSLFDIQELQQKATSLGDLEAIQTEISTICQQINDIRSRKSKAEGMIESEKRKACELMQQLKSEKYVNIENNFREQTIRAETTKLAIKDLTKFHNALDHSLIQFHTQQMREINAVLKELWQQTYHGGDIDFIEIQSTQAIDKRRNYNYSVVMYQRNTMLDMRGRCSAGQKVLASLLIRLSLAECLCINCGVIALDEPTTNLDTKNIESLAIALKTVIKRRRDQNFQLIVITHDVKFAEMIKDEKDGAYQVFKDAQGHSKVRMYYPQN
ncbi:hypothetical protein RFI_11836 [Reticulomyxa filosa]|uniref:DNA repair protein RAD50 n=1 Tax=Reticulomyxa filosa TaxID=46433 RepID=X6NH44_RETFI|nr:hypothetical protein RFI_11836 [Reticulomyxa filosa]|eukprot:ETO25301.1 hypothetical protein RFI_11836 [Reticulomyxa filosa]